MFFLGLRLKEQQLPREAVLLVPEEAQEDAPDWADTFQASACVMSASIPLANAGHKRRNRSHLLIEETTSCKGHGYKKGKAGQFCSLP